MCLLQGLVLDREVQHPVRVLIDSGSTYQYMSSAFARKTSLEVVSGGDQPHWVQVANGTYMDASNQVKCTLVLGRYRTRIDARILDIPEFDIILGFDWLRTANPIINWQDLSIQVRDDSGELHELFPKEIS